MLDEGCEVVGGLVGVVVQGCAMFGCDRMPKSVGLG